MKIKKLILILAVVTLCLTSCSTSRQVVAAGDAPMSYDTEREGAMNGRATDVTISGKISAMGGVIGSSLVGASKKVSSGVKNSTKSLKNKFKSK